MGRAAIAGGGRHPVGEGRWALPRAEHRGVRVHGECASQLWAPPPRPPLDPQPNLPSRSATDLLL